MTLCLSVLVWGFHLLQFNFMFTLLPNEYKNKLLGDYRLRLYFIFVFMFLIAIVILIGSFLPSFITVKSEYSSLLKQESILSRSIAQKNNSDLSKIIQNLAESINLIDKPDRLSASEIQKILKYENQNITITKIDYNVVDQNDYNMTVSGLASTRKSLSDFAKKLESVESFKMVNLPISNLAKESDISFNITISGKFEL